MENPTQPDGAAAGQPAMDRANFQVIYPLTFSTQLKSGVGEFFLRDPAARKLVEFFEQKGLRAIKEEDQREQWYQDWIDYQAKHQLYASLLSPTQFSSLGNELNLLRLTRFLEVFAYFSPAHGYSLQVSFLGLFAILMGSNVDLKKEAIRLLEKGSLFAMGASEKDHGSDLLANDFSVEAVDAGKFIANGSKYYIGNANCASLITVLARKMDGPSKDRSRRALPVLIALRPSESKGFGKARKIPTLGIRAAFVGEFHVRNYELSESDFVAEGRTAWDAVLGTVTLGKFFLGFGAIGICERSFEESIEHLTSRILYGKPVVEMPHIAFTVARAFARLAAMKLYAYRALDYVHAASANDRRYLLFTAVQKAKVSTEGVKVMSLLSECIGAKGFETDTFFEMALRDAQLIPGLEGSTHINLAMTSQFVPNYFKRGNAKLDNPKSISSGECAAAENPYLMEARSGSFNTVIFGPYLQSFKPIGEIKNVRIFARQVKAFCRFVRGKSFIARATDTQLAIAVGQCLASIAYGQLIAENCVVFGVPAQVVSAIFHLLVNDLSAAAQAFASSSRLDTKGRIQMKRLIAIPKTAQADWDFVTSQAIEQTRRPGPSSNGH